MSKTITIKLARPTEEDFRNLAKFMSDFDYLSQYMDFESVSDDEFKDEFDYCIVDDEFDFRAFLQHWDGKLCGGLSRVFYACHSLVSAVCDEGSDVVELDPDKLEFFQQKSEAEHE